MQSLLYQPNTILHIGHTFPLFLLSFLQPSKPTPWSEMTIPFFTYLYLSPFKDHFKLLLSRKHSLNTIIHIKNKIPLVFITCIIHFPFSRIQPTTDQNYSGKQKQKQMVVSVLNTCRHFSNHYSLNTIV